MLKTHQAFLSAATILATLCLASSTALACPGCIEANEANREAFLFTTGLLTLIPLFVIGCIVRYIQLRARRLQDEEETRLSAFTERPDPQP